MTQSPKRKEPFYRPMAGLLTGVNHNPALKRWAIVTVFEFWNRSARRTKCHLLRPANEHIFIVAQRFNAGLSGHTKCKSARTKEANLFSFLQRVVPGTTRCC